MPKSNFIENWKSFFMGVCACGILFFSLGFKAPSENPIGRYQATAGEERF